MKHCLTERKAYKCSHSHTPGVTLEQHIVYLRPCYMKTQFIKTQSVKVERVKVGAKANVLCECIVSYLQMNSFKFSSIVDSCL